MYENKKYALLIVEDEFLNAEFVEQVLVGLGHQVVASVENADEALEVAKNTKIDFVFMDINLKGAKDGLQCANMLNKIYAMPIIYMTAFSDDTIMEEIMETNLYGYIIKPFTHQTIQAALAVAIKKLSDMQQVKVSHKRLIQLGNQYTYNTITKSLIINNSPAILSKLLTEILYILCLNINQIVSYESLENCVWQGKAISLNTIRDTVLRLRHKVPLLDIQNVSGVGYFIKSSKN